MRATLEKGWLALRDRGLIFVLVALAAFLVYLRTLAPDVLTGDAGEFEFAAWGWTLAHPTGYPLYLLIGGLWQHLLPIGNPAFRLNLLSAVFAALVVGLTYRILFRLTRHRSTSLIAAFALAVAPTFWSQATESEVYALNSLFIAILTWLALKWESERRLRYSALWAFVFGLALTHHRSTVLLIPGFAAFFAWAIYARARRFARVGERAVARGLVNLHSEGKSKSLEKAGQGVLANSGIKGFSFPLRRDLLYIILAGAPLLLYAYIPLRAGATPYARLQVSPSQTIVAFENTPRGWLAEVTGQSFGAEIAVDQRTTQALRALPDRIVHEFNPLGAALGVLGLAVLIWRRRALITSLSVLGLAAIVLFDSVYHIGDISDFYTPAYFFFALWIGVGAGAIFDLLRRMVQLRSSLLPAIALLIGIAAVPLQNLSTNFVEQDRSLHTEWSTRWRSILTSPSLAPNAILISNDRDEMTPMWYLQLVEGLRPDALGLFPLVSPDPAYATTPSLLDSVINSGRPVLLIKSLPGITLRYQLVPAPPDLYRVVKASAAAPQFTSNVVIGNRLQVIGYSAGRELESRNELAVTVYWQPLVRLERDYSTSLQIMDDQGTKVAQGDDHKPGGETFPTTQWHPGEQLQDAFSVKLPPDVAPGLYHIYVRVYVSGTDESLGELTEIGTIEINE